MRIGAASSLPPYLPNPKGRAEANPRPESSPPEPQPQKAATPFEWMKQAQQAESASYYSTDRTLSFSGRAAIDTYLTNASLMWRPGEAELLGIDLYA